MKMPIGNKKDVFLNEKERNYIGIKEEGLHFSWFKYNVKWFQEINKRGYYITISEYQDSIGGKEVRSIEPLPWAQL